MNPRIEAILMGENQNSYTLENSQKLKYEILKHYGLLTEELEVVSNDGGGYDHCVKSEQNPNENIYYRHKAMEVADEEYVALLTKYKRERNVAKIGDFPIRILNLLTVIHVIGIIAGVIMSYLHLNGEQCALVIVLNLLINIPILILLATVLSTAEAVNELIDC